MMDWITFIKSTVSVAAYLIAVFSYIDKDYQRATMWLVFALFFKD